MQDPFVAVKGEVEASLSNAVTLFQSWNRIYSTASSTTNEELVWTADELKTAIEGIEQDLEDLEETINVAEQNPEHFSLSAKELSSRRQFITRTRETIRDMQATLANPPPKKKLPTSKAAKDRQALFDGGSSSSRNNMSANPYRDIPNDSQRFIDSESGQQAILMQEQDYQLDGISGTLVNMKEIASTMNQEVDDQVVLLEDVESRVDRTSKRLRNAMKRVVTILKKEEESKSPYAIACLIIVLVILLILVITV